MAQDLRKYARQTTTRLIIGGIALLFIIGDGLIYFFYGEEAGAMATLCLIVGLSPLVVIWLALEVIGLIARRANR